MKLVHLLAATTLTLAAAPALADDAVRAPIQAMEAAFNKGDIAAAKATHVAAPSILDEVAAPFIWSGPTAFDDWIATLGRTEEIRGRSGGQVTIGAPTRETIDGDSAYVIVPSRYAFLQKGVKMEEIGTMTFALTKVGTAWKIQAWSWSSPAATPVK